MSALDGLLRSDFLFPSTCSVYGGVLVDDVDVVSSKSFNNRNAITREHHHILSELRIEGAVSNAPLSVISWFEATSS